MAKFPGISQSVIRRMPRYYRFLEALKAKGAERISSREFAQLTGFTASQIRQDLNCFGGFGQQGYGYNVESLHGEIGRILGVGQKRPTILLGAGNLGLALANHVQFSQWGFELIGIFDSDKRKIGRKIRDCVILDIEELGPFCDGHKPQVAILCLPSGAVEAYASLLAGKGVTGFWNFTSQDLSFGGIVAENVYLGDSLMTLGLQVNDTILLNP